MTPSKPKRPAYPPFAYEGLDRVIHERARLSLLTALVAHAQGLSFGDLKQLCALTDGNLNRHLEVLEAAKLIDIRKGAGHNRPRTVCRITADGRRRFMTYLGVLEQILLDASSKSDAEKPSTSRGFLR